MFILIVLAVILFFLFYSTRKADKSLNKLSSYLKGSVSKFSFITSSFHGEYEGLKFSILLNLITNDATPPCLKIILSKDFSFKLAIYQGKFVSNFWNRIGSLSSQKKLNRDIFEDGFSIFSNNPTIAKDYLNSENIKRAIKELFGKGFNMLLIDGKRISIKKTNYIGENDLEQANMLDILSGLSLLASASK